MGKLPSFFFLHSALIEFGFIASVASDKNKFCVGLDFDHLSQCDFSMISFE